MDETMKVVTTCRLPVVKETDLCVLSHFRHVWFFATLWTSSLPHSSVHGILQAPVLVWVAMPFSRRSSQPRDWTLGLLHCRPFLYRWATGEAQRKPGEIYIHIICSMVTTVNNSVLCWPKNLFRFFHKILQKNLNELLSNSICWNLLRE